ncbi:hypothetical protein K435DRAFT_871398 [Dendrothele bispora CBS 962.96]|uniref:F-box domain-containing protein n=1 Tax=Dendrothele bispora (strain CBS 962.96) TaxID=1314807 RepID=A0A4S8L470_DENBC|nr:hypothetical protein K435DRAFT_871398 [Dendrothele bispora CBS 962.96]
MESHQKQRRKKAKTSTNTVPIRRSSRVAARQGWRIPPEILLLIMNELRNSKASLQKAALVCRAWRGPAQVYLFSQMRIRHSLDCTRISKIIQNSPHIASHVNRLVVEEFDEAYASITDRPLISRASYLRSRDATEIASILGSSVRELGVSVYPLDKNNVEFLKHMRQVQTLKVERCDETRVDILAKLIQGMRGLTSLHLFGGEVEPDAEEYEADRLESLADTTTTSSAVLAEPIVDMPPFRLTRLTLESIEHRLGLLKFLLDPRHFDLGALEDLDLTWMEVEDQFAITTLDYTFLDRLFGRVGNSLKGLTLGVSGGRHSSHDRYLEHYTMSPMTSPLQCLVNLESFSIISQEIDRLDPSLYLALLASVPSSFLTRMRFKTDTNIEDFPELTQVFFAQPEEDPTRHWKAVDSLLGDADRFPVLQSLTITVVLLFESDLRKPTLNDIEVCGNPSCYSCAAARHNDDIAKELAEKNAEDSVNRKSTQMVRLFEETLTRLKERGVLNVEVEKLDLSLDDDEYDSAFWKWDD